MQIFTLSRSNRRADIPMTNRRHFLRSALVGAAGASVAWPLPRLSNAQPGGLAVQEIGPDIVMITGSGSNVLAAADDEGVIMVDGGLAQHNEVLLARVDEIHGGRPVRCLFNTHWHPAQTGSNLALAQAGAELVSQVNTALWLGTDIRRPWEDFTHPPLPSAARPGTTFHEQGRAVMLGGNPLSYGHLLQAHTDGDCYVHFPEANVLACGGVIAGDRWPEIDWWTGGWFGGLVEGIETLMQVGDESTRFVPSHGPVLSYAELEAQRDMYADLFLHFRDELLFRGLSPAEAVASRPTAGLHEHWPGRDRFVRLAFESLWGFYAPDV